MNKFVFRSIRVALLLAFLLGSYTSADASSSAPVPASAARIFYVAVSGNDANTGTSSAPFKTVQKCLNVVAAGDTCLIKAGTYNEVLTLKTSGTASLPINIKCDVQKACTINSGNAQTLGTSNNTHYYTFDGLRFIATAVTSQATLYFGQGTLWSKDDKTRGNNGFILRNCYVEGDVKFFGHNNLVENCEFNGKNTWSNGITDGYAASYNNTYRNNFIYGYKVRSIWTMQYTDNILIEGNTVVNGHIDCDGAGHPVTRCLVRNNTIHDAQMGIQIENSFNSVFEGNVIYNVAFGMLIENYGLGPDFYADAEYRETASNILVRNNLIYNVTSNGIFILGASGGKVTNNTIQYPQTGTGYYGAIALAKYDAYYSDDWEITNNIFSSKNVSFLFASSAAGLPGLVSDHNFYDGAKFIQRIDSAFNNKTILQWQAIGLDTHGTFADPLFVNPAAGDFHLRANSPACKSGVNGSYSGAFPCNVTSPTSTATLPPTVTTVPTTAVPPTATPTATASSTPAAPTSTPTPPASLGTTYDDKDSAFVYSTGWKNINKGLAYNGSYKQTARKGSYATLAFTGQSFSILYKSGPTGGKINIYVDDVLVGTIDEKTTSAAFQKQWDFTGQLTAGQHTLRLVPIVPASANKIFTVDAVIVY